MARIDVVGSINLDLVVTAERLPHPGETLTDARFATHPGGKGANQALAARRLGADVAMTGRVGSDANAELALSLLRSDGVDLSGVTVDEDLPTGIASIVVGADGENQIVVAPGANRSLTPEHVDTTGADAVICQLEIPLDVVDRAAGTQALFVLNAAPFRSLPSSVLRRCDVLVVNETEHGALGAQTLEVNGLVALTLGAGGASAMRAGEVVASAAAPAVEVVDTVGAGDTFVAALAVALVDGWPVADALRWAVTAGSLATTRAGAQPSLPHRSDVDSLYHSTR